MLKRLFDAVLSFVGIMASSPLWLLITCLIFFEDGLPIFFPQERVGKNGKIIKVIKFRTMKHLSGKSHLDIDLENDPRITRVGRLLRVTAIDELPQLWNILKGEMSFVGPRALPMIIDDNEKQNYARLDQIPGFEIRSRVRPGLTGISQIYASKDAGREEKFKYDIEYVNKMNFWLDLNLIIISFWITLRGSWEKRGNKL